MSEDVSRLFTLIFQSFTDPASAAETVYSRRFDRNALWSGLLLVTVISVLLIALSNAIIGVPPEMEDAIVQITPFAFALILGASLVILVFALYFVGQMLGGKGHFPETVVCVIWLQVLSMALQVVQLIAMLLMPPVVGIVSLVGLGLLLFALVHFINVLHHFDSLLKSFGTFALSLIGIAFGLSIILAAVGVSAQGLS